MENKNKITKNEVNTSGKKLMLCAYNNPKNTSK